MKRKNIDVNEVDREKNDGENIQLVKILVINCPKKEQIV